VIIPLGNYTEQSSPAQVSSSLNTLLLSSNITINLAQASANLPQDQVSIGENTRALNISGSISPAYTGENVTIYVNDGSSYDYFTAVTDDTGGYLLTWNFSSAGTYSITASWSGTSNYAGADSETLTVFVGPQSFVQFQSTGYNYIFGQASLASYVTLPMQGVKDYLSIPLGTVVSFSYDFTLLPAGQTVSNVQTQTITIPGSQQTIRLGRNSPPTTIMIPAQTITVPVNVPQDLSPLMLPDGFNQTINDQFCFILQNSSGNFSLNANALSDDEMSNILQGNPSNTAFMNASQSIRENTWYGVSESVSDNGITADLYNANRSILETLASPYNATGDNEAIMLITNNLDSAVVFTNLTINEPIINPTPSPTSNGKTTIESGPIVLGASLSILIVAAFSVILIFAEKKKQRRIQNQNNSSQHPDMSANQVNP
jgi:hypothetical protein